MKKDFLYSPRGDAFSMVDYFEIQDAAKQIVEEAIESDDELKEKFDEFSKDYSIYTPYIDFILCHLNYKIKSPFIVDEGILTGNKDGLIYTTFDEDGVMTPINYPTAKDADINVHKFDVNNLNSSIISPNGISYDINRDKDYIHQYVYEIILLQVATASKKLYDDFKKIYDEDSELYYTINAYFINRLGYVQLQKYHNNTGYIFYNRYLCNDKLKNIISEIRLKYPRINHETRRINLDEISDIKDNYNEMSDIYEGRRI